MYTAHGLGSAPGLAYRGSKGGSFNLHSSAQVETCAETMGQCHRYKNNPCCETAVYRCGRTVVVDRHTWQHQCEDDRMNMGMMWQAFSMQSGPVRKRREMIIIE